MQTIMKQSLSIAVLLLAGITAAGCSTPQIERDLDQLKYEVAALKTRIGEQEGTKDPLRKDLANYGLRMDEMLTQIQQVQGSVDENNHQVQKELQDIKQRLTAVEGGKTAPSAEGQPAYGYADETVTAPKPAAQMDAEEVYAQAYQIYKQDQFPEARKAFQSFLKQFPQTEYSDNAQFWIGESYFRQQKYEEAILAYEDVVKKYPQGNKVPDALFKQGLCFKAIGDSTSANIILQRIVESYPGSPQAVSAKREMERGS